MNFNKNGTKVFMSEAREAMELLAKKHGVKMAKSSARYSGEELSVSLRFETVGEDGISDAAKSRWDQYTAYHGELCPEMFGKTFNHDGTIYEICDFSPRSRKYPVLAKSMGNGKIYKFPTTLIAMLVKA